MEDASSLSANGGERCGWLQLRCPLRSVQCSGPGGEACIFVLLIRGLTTTQRTAPAPELAAVAVLSQREREVMREFLLDGSADDIAKKLSISVHTVRNHLKAIFRKLDVGSQVELLRRFQHVADFL